MFFSELIFVKDECKYYISLTQQMIMIAIQTPSQHIPTNWSTALHDQSKQLRDSIQSYQQPATTNGH